SVLAGNSPSQFMIVSDACNGLSALLPGATCAIVARFKPTVSGAQTANFSVNTAGVATPIYLSGQALAPAAISFTETSHDFGSMVLGDAAPSHTFNLTNHGDVATGLLNASLTGTNTADFHVDANNCGQLAAGATCTIAVSFTASLAAGETAT